MVGTTVGLSASQPANAIQSSLLDPQLLGDRWIVPAHLLDEPLGVLAADEDLDDGRSLARAARGRRGDLVATCDERIGCGACI